MAAIFFFSSKNAEESSEMSGSFTKSLLGFSGEEPDGAKEAKDGSFIETVGMAVRKSAHFLIFFVLGFCAANALRLLTYSKRRVFWISLCYCVLYAVTDELHQYFVPGRSCMWQDCVIDAAGAAAGIGAVFFVFWAVKKIKGELISN
jgi:VanZ family protein